MTNHELAILIAKRKDEIIIFTGMDGNHCVTPDIESVSMNGDCVQINTAESVEPDTSWAFDRLSVLVTAIKCLQQGDWENIDPQFAEQIGDQLLHGLALTDEQEDALDEH